MLRHPNHRTSTSPPSRKTRSFPTEKEQLSVSPTKAEITRTVTKAKALATAAEAVLLLLKDPTIKHSDDIDEKTVRSAASLVFQMKAVVAKIEDFDLYIYNKFQKPELKDSPDRETLFRDVTNTLLGSGADSSQKKLAAQIAEMESVLMGYGQTLSSFQPSNQPQDPQVSDPRDEMENYINEPHLSQKTINLVDEMPCSIESPASSRTITSSQSRDLSMMFSDSAFPNRTKELQQSLIAENRGLQEENAKHFHAQYEESQRRLALEMKDQTFPLRENVQETPFFRSANQINNLNIEPETAETPNATNRLDMNDLMNAFLSISQNQRIGAHIHERDESVRSRATSRRTQARRSARSESSYVRRYERDESSESEDESNHPVPFRTATIRRNRSLSPEPTPRKNGLKIETRLKFLQKFDGTNDLDLFQTLFTKFILNDDELSPEEKRAVLMNHITGPATICVSHAKDSKTAIAVTFISLNKVYGKANSKHNLLKKLESLPFHQTDPETMRQDAVSLTNVLQQLKDRGLPADDHMTMWAIACKLPEKMQKSLAKYTVKIGGALTHDLILDRISRDIETMALEQTYISQRNSEANELSESYVTTNLSNVNSSKHRTPAQFNQNNPRERERKLVYDPAQFPFEYVDPVTKSKLEGYYTPGSKGVNLKIISRTFPLSEKEPRPCNVCQGDHNEIRCTLKSHEFREMCKRKGLCPICARKHDITVCVYPYRCGYCNGLHHLGGCPQKEFYRDKRNYPKGAQPVATLYRANKTNQLK
ncbi:hypothetical protein GCK72_022698 [Caenorhabditis remanei]|uniref:Uncharacterized protein n=1 Tax=Caenorhabditis remanei TaxID=31234 RepID=A0A6A5FUR6_CAERE|nr:hypothetical protein GCK72_022698 [Caenorhabditis remanei]KAF1746245.1 hypothetical protein GCK72_022698 [Caenorhabditis remanei]